jgi:hypothetical protein
LILEEDRKPTDASRSLWILACGILLGLATILGSIVASRGDDEE